MKGDVGLGHAQPGQENGQVFPQPGVGEWVPFAILLNLEERGIGGTRMTFRAVTGHSGERPSEGILRILTALGD